MKDFEGFIKNYATRDFIYFFAEKSIEIYKNQVENRMKWEYPKVCVNLQTGVRYNYSVWRFLLWQEEKVTHHRKQQCAK